MTQQVLPIEVTVQDYQPIMSFRTRSSVEKLPEVIRPAYERILAYLKEMDITPTGPPFVTYYTMDLQDLDVEMGFPVEDLLPGEGDLCPGEIEKSTVVSFMHKGPYEGLHEVFSAMATFLEEKGLQAKGVSYEVYYNGPNDVQSSEELLTKILLPVYDKTLE